MIQEGVTKLVAGVQWILNGAFLACPLTWIVVGFGVLVGVILYCWNKFERFRQVVFTLWEAMKELGRVLWSALITPFEQILKGLGSIGEALLALVNRQFKEAATKAVTGFKEIGKGFLNGNPIGVTANVIANGDWKGVQKRGVQKGSESWAASQEKEPDTGKQPEAKGSGSQPFSLANQGIEVPSFSKNAGSDLTGDVLENPLSGDAGFTGEPDINESARFPWDSSNSSPVIAPPGNSVNTIPQSGKYSLGGAENSCCRSHSGCIKHSGKRTGQSVFHRPGRHPTVRYCTKRSERTDFLHGRPCRPCQGGPVTGTFQYTIA